MDALWINGIFSAKQHENAVYQWQRRMIKTANRIIGLDREMRSMVKKIQADHQPQDNTNEVSELNPDKGESQK